MRMLYALALILGCASSALAVSPYQGTTLSTPTGRATENISGYLFLAPSSNTPNAPTIFLDGVTGGINGSSITVRYGVQGTTGTFSSTVTALSYFGDGSHLTGVVASSGTTRLQVSTITVPDTIFTQATYSQCFATAPLTIANSSVAVFFAGSIENDSASAQTMGLNVLVNSRYITGFSSLAGIVQSTSIATSQSSPASFSIAVTGLTPGTNSFCLTGRTTGGNARIRNDSSIVPSFGVIEIGAGTGSGAGGGVPSGLAGGSLAGTYPNPTIAAGAIDTTALATDAVTTTKILNGAVTVAKMNQNNCATGEVLTWGGTAWGCAAVAGGGSTTTIIVQNITSFTSTVTVTVTSTMNVLGAANFWHRVAGSTADMSGSALFDFSNLVATTPYLVHYECSVGTSTTNWAFRINHNNTNTTYDWANKAERGDGADYSHAGLNDTAFPLLSVKSEGAMSSRGLSGNVEVHSTYGFPTQAIYSYNTEFYTSDPLVATARGGGTWRGDGANGIFNSITFITGEAGMAKISCAFDLFSYTRP